MNFPIAETFWLVFVFLIGINVGSFLNVVIGRLPLEKSILWPNSRCLSCLHSLSLLDNLPIIGWLRLRGRCRYCKSPFSSRYLWVELAVGIGFTAIWYLEFTRTHTGGRRCRGRVDADRLHWYSLVVFAHHAVLFSLLLSVAMCDWDSQRFPLMTTAGTAIGLCSPVCCPVSQRSRGCSQPANRVLAGGIVQNVRWGFLQNSQTVPSSCTLADLGPVPEWIGPSSLGRSNGDWALRAIVGMVLIRFVKFTFEKGLGRGGGLGDADLMMMAGRSSAGSQCLSPSSSVRLFHSRWDHSD